MKNNYKRNIHRKFSILLRKHGKMKDNSSTTGCTIEVVHIELYHKVVYILLTILIGFAGVGLNSYVLYAIRTHTTLQTYANGFVVNLCITDLLCIISLLGWTSTWIYRHPILELIMNKTFSVSNSVSIMILAAIAADRFASLKYSLHYSSRMTGTKVMTINICFWFYSIVVSVLPLTFKMVPGFTDNKCPGNLLATVIGKSTIDKLLVCLLYLPCLIIIIGSYFRIYRIARYHSRTIEAVDRSVVYNYPRHRVQRSVKYLRTLTLVLFPMLAILPEQVYGILEVMDKKIYFYLVLLASVNLILNPFIYAYNRSEFQNALKPPTPIRIPDAQRREQEIAEALSTIFGKEGNESNCSHSESKLELERKQSKENETANDNISWKGFTKRDNSFSRVSVKLNDDKGDMQLTIEDLDYINSSRASLQLSVEKFGQLKRRVTVCRSYSSSSVHPQENTATKKDNDVSDNKKVCNKDIVEVVSL